MVYFDVTGPTTAKTRSDVELELVTGTAANQTATVRWLMTGITIEEDQ